MTSHKFLSVSFVDSFRHFKSPFGFNGLGEFIYYRTYSRVKDDGETEDWVDTVERVVNGTYMMIKKHIEKDSEGERVSTNRFNSVTSLFPPEVMFEKIFHLKFSPPGRGLWTMGTKVTEEKGLYSALNNCAFISTKNIKTELARPFKFLMDQLMLGVGVGFDVRGENELVLHKPSVEPLDFIIKNRSDINWNDMMVIARSVDKKRKAPPEDNESAKKRKNSLTVGVDMWDRLPFLPFVDTKKVSLNANEKRLNDILITHNYDNATEIVRKYIILFTDLLDDCDKRIADIKKGEEWLKDSIIRDIEIYRYNFDMLVKVPRDANLYVIEDTRESWVESLALLLESYFIEGKKFVAFDYSKIRKAGIQLKTFGGTSSGPVPLIDLHCILRMKLDDNINKPISITTISDIMNLIAKTVVAGNIRRSSLINLGPNNEEFLSLKDYTKNPSRSSYGWTSNNSVVCKVGDNYKSIATKMNNNGEPGIFWLRNAQEYSRMSVPLTPDYKDIKVIGTNPCITGDSLITTDKGLIKVTDLVGVQFNSIVDDIAYPSTDVGFFSTGHKQVYKISLANGSTLKATADHVIYTREGKLKVKYLTEFGAPVITEGDTSSNVISVTLVGEENVYDCTILNNHCYYANGMLISNCSEQSLEHGECCNLVECYLDRSTSLGDFIETLRFAFLYAKTVTLGSSHWKETDDVMSRNRRIGCSLTGITQYLASNSLEDLKRYCQSGFNFLVEFDIQLSKMFNIPVSIKHTTIKPSGTVSLLAGSPPGCHYPEARYYKRRVRVMSNSPLLIPLKEAGYHIEPCIGSEKTTVVVEFPVKFNDNVRTNYEVSMEEKLELAACLQEWWSDNQVSVTIDFDKVTEGPRIEEALNKYQYRMKSVSFLPRSKNSYPQMPYESITMEEYQKEISHIKEVKFTKLKKDKKDDIETDFGCDGGACMRV